MSLLGWPPNHTQPSECQAGTAFQLRITRTETSLTTGRSLRNPVARL